MRRTLSSTLEVRWGRQLPGCSVNIFSSKILKYIPDSGLSRSTHGVSVCTQCLVKHRRCSRTWRETQYLMNTLYSICIVDEWKAQGGLSCLSWPQLLYRACAYVCIGRRAAAYRLCSLFTGAFSWFSWQQKDPLPIPLPCYLLNS